LGTPENLRFDFQEGEIPMKLRIAHVVVASLSLFLSLIPLTLAQSSAQSASASGLPRLVRFGGTAKDLNGSPVTGVVGITFALYSEKTGGAPLWLETQNATADSSGHYTVLLGSTKPEGLPADLFTSEQARWVGVQVSGQPEQPRVLLVSAPYALKAGDAETIGGLPPSAFVLAAPAALGSATASSSPESVTSLAATDVTTTGGTAHYLPMFSGAATIVDSAVFQSATSPLKIGINTTTPATVLDVNGGGTIRGSLTLPATGTATAAAGKDSQQLNLVASSFNSTSSAAVNQTFQWQAEPSATDTTAPSGTLNLRYGLGATAPSETGLRISSKGVVTFAAGQTFPGTGEGTLTGITTATGSGLSGGGTTGTLSLKVPAAGITNAMLADSKITLNNNTAGGLTTPGAMALGSTYTIGLKPCATSQILQYSGTTWNCVAPTGTGTITGVTAGTDLTGGGTGGKVTLNLDTTKVPLLATSNTFTGNETVETSTTDAVDGYTSGPGKSALVGVQSATSGESFGVFAETFDPTGAGVAGINYGSSYQATGVLGASGTGYGVRGAGTSSQSLAAVAGFGFTAPSGSGGSGTIALAAYGGDGDPSTGLSSGGSGVVASGGKGGGGGGSDGIGGAFEGGGSYNGGDDGGGDGIYSVTGSGYAGNFGGDVQVSGTFYNNGGAFKIDHPLDPANKYLYHSFVESPDMMNIYNGNLTTDAEGAAVVTLPEWFETLNRDFRYQLTVIGQFAQAIISSKVANHQFTIRTDKPNVEVSWQITGIRQDVWANQHRIPVEEQKNARERGYYIRPELYGASEEQSIAWARHPQMMKKIQEARTLHLTTVQKLATPLR
jgi:hypothetical protein